MHLVLREGLAPPVVTQEVLAPHDHVSEGHFRNQRLGVQVVAVVGQLLLHPRGDLSETRDNNLAEAQH